MFKGLEITQSHLTATSTPDDAVSLLEVNEQLHTLAPRLKNRRPEDVKTALKLVEQYTEAIGPGSSAEYKRIKELLPSAELFEIENEGLTYDELLEKLGSALIVVSRVVKRMLVSDLGSNGLIYKGNRKVIHVVMFDSGDLNPNNDRLEMPEVIRRAKELGLAECSPEDAAYFHLQNKQFHDDTFMVGLKPRLVANKKYGVFFRHNLMSTMDAYEVNDSVPPFLKVIFCLP